MNTLALDFADQTPGVEVTNLLNLGTAPVAISVRTLNGGTVTGAESMLGQDGALRFPAFNASLSGPRAVVSLVNASTTDAMSPGTRDFAWGADFSLDATSSSASTGSADNGDNLLQRGLAGSRAQFKLQLDAHRASCRLETANGYLKVTVPVTVTPSVWYHASCSRTGNQLTATLGQYDAAGTLVQSWSRSGSKSLGALTWSSAAVPVSVGGKLNPDDTIVTKATDQFNGFVDNVFLQIQP